MQDSVMVTDLMAEIPPGGKYAEAARGWLDGVLNEVFPDLLEGLRTRPSARAVSRNIDDAPYGAPGDVRGEILVGANDSVRRRSVLYSEKSWQRTLTSLDESPLTVLLSIQIVGPDGYLSQDSASVSVVRSEFDPEWVRFRFFAPAIFRWRAHLAERPEPDAPVVQVRSWRGGAEPEIVERDSSEIETAQPGPGDWKPSSQVQDRWAQFTKIQASRVGASAGMMTRRLGPYGLEKALYPDWPPDTVFQKPGWAAGSGMLSSDRDLLYRFSWVTIAPPELTARLGGPTALTASGAFHEVSELPNQSTWLRATPLLTEFTQDRVDAVASALATVLVPASTY